MTRCNHCYRGVILGWVVAFLENGVNNVEFCKARCLVRARALFPLSPLVVRRWSSSVSGSCLSVLLVARSYIAHRFASGYIDMKACECCVYAGFGFLAQAAGVVRACAHILFIGVNHHGCVDISLEFHRQRLINASCILLFWNLKGLVSNLPA